MEHELTERELEIARYEPTACHICGAPLERPNAVFVPVLSDSRTLGYCCRATCVSANFKEREHEQGTDQ